MCNVNKIHRTVIHSLSFKHINTSRNFSSSTDYNYNLNYIILQLQLRKLQQLQLQLQLLQIIQTIKPTMTTTTKQTIQIQLHADHI